MTSHLVIPDKTLANRHRVKAWAKANPDKVRVNKLRYRDKNPARYIHKCAKDNAKAAGTEFSIDESDIIIPKVCPVFKVPFEWGTRYAPSIDRIDSAKGYIKGNVQIISRKANVMKNDATADELQQFAKWVLGSW